MTEAAQAPPAHRTPTTSGVPVMTMRDVMAYVAPERVPTHVGYRGLDVYGMGPPSSDGSTVGEALNVLEGFDLDPEERTQAFHLFLEASRFSFATGTRSSADEDFVDDRSTACSRTASRRSGARSSTHRRRRTPP